MPAALPACPTDSMLISPAYAQVAGGAPPQGRVLPLLGHLAPLQQRQRTLQNAIAAVRKGDQVITAGGVLGRVTKVEDRFVELEIAPNTRIRVVKATLAEITSSTAKPAND